MLADFKPEWRELTFRGGSFQVRGLSLEDISVMVRHHLEDFKTMYETFAQAAEVSVDRTETMLSFVRDMPDLAAHLIAAAAGEETAVEMARKLPFPVQVAAITAIMELTFDDIGGPKNFGPALLKLLGGVGISVPQRVRATPETNRPLSSSITASAVM
jgi:hypothetical protein